MALLHDSPCLMCREKAGEAGLLARPSRSAALQSSSPASMGKWFENTHLPKQ